MSGSLALSAPQPDDNEEPLSLNVPESYRPDLTELGIEEYERGVCTDTYANRAILRRAKLAYTSVYTVNGVLTQFIAVLSPEMTQAATKQRLEEKKILLTDDRSLSSDYKTGYALLLIEDIRDLVPAWVVNRTQLFLRKEEAGTLVPKKDGLPQRCRKIKADGMRCMIWASGQPQYHGYCRTHLQTGGAVDDLLKTTRLRMVQAAPAALDTLEFLHESAVSEPVRLKAATEILDRAGIRGGFEIDQEVTVQQRPAHEVVLERINKLKQSQIQAAAPEEITDAEVVPDDE